MRKDGAVMAAGIAMRPDAGAAVLRAVETSLAQGRRVLLQIMDSSKLGWRAPSEACLDEIARRWPRKVQIVVDARQVRLGRRRLRSYLDRGYMVLTTGSKFFGGPAFSGALLVLKGLQAQRNVQHVLDRIAHVLVKIEKSAFEV
ncbi:hypothetical protein ACVWWG_008813 [Bradyrhizobium sp. LB7.2]